MENLFNKVVGMIKNFLTGKLGALVVLALAAVAVVFAIFGSVALIGFTFGLIALASAIYLRATGTKTDFTALATALAAVAIILGAVMFSLNNTASSEFARGRWYVEGNNNYEAFRVQNAELNGQINEYNGDNKLKESLRKKVDKKVKKINEKYSDEKKKGSSSDDYDF